MKALLDGLRALGPARLTAMGAVALGLLALLAFMVMRAGSGDQMALLYGDLDPRDASQMVDKLNQQHIPYRVGAGGGQILVPAESHIAARTPVVTADSPVSEGFGRNVTVTSPSGDPKRLVLISPLTTVRPSALTLEEDRVRVTFKPPLSVKFACAASPGASEKSRLCGSKRGAVTVLGPPEGVTV